MGVGIGANGESSGTRSPENIADEMDKLWAWLVEKSHEDPTKAQQVRHILYQVLNKLGVVNSSGIIDNNKWCDLVSARFLRKQNPIKPDGYPEYEEFEAKFKEYSEEFDLSEIKRHTNDLPRYLYGLGQVIHDEIVYKNIFENDDIIIKDSQITIGKHREAAIDILRKCGFNKLTPWVRYDYGD